MLFLAFLLSRVITNLQNYDLKTQTTKNVSCFWNVGETLKTIWRSCEFDIQFDLSKWVTLSSMQQISIYSSYQIANSSKYVQFVMKWWHLWGNSFIANGRCIKSQVGLMYNIFVHIVFKHCFWWQSDESMLVNVSFSDTTILQESRNIFLFDCTVFPYTGGVTRIHLQW